MVTTYEQEQSRLEALIANTPELFKRDGDLLYIGGSPGKVQLLGHLQQYNITILEIDAKNAAGLNFPTVVGDVRSAYNLFSPKQFEVIIWWHGPEHVYHHEIEGLLFDLANKCKSLIILGAPYGYYPQGVVDGNIHERHLCHLMPEDFKKWGYRSATVGEPESGPEGCIVAWRKFG